MDVQIKNELIKLLPLLVPVFMLELGLMIAALVNLAKRKKVRFNNKLIWVFVILILGLFGPIIYFVARGDEE